jgi:hypothetical protein
MKLISFALFSLSLAPVALSLSTGLEKTQWSNAKRMANGAYLPGHLFQAYINLLLGLPPRAPRRLYNNNVAREPTPSSTPSPLPTAAAVQAYVANVVTQSAAPTAQPTLARRQTVGSSVGYLTQVAQLVPTNHNVRFSLTTESAVAKGLYPVS